LENSKEITNFVQKLVESQKDLDHDIARFVDDNFFELLLPMENTQEITWIIQNSINDHNLEAMVEACKKNGLQYYLVDYIPFSNELPSFPRNPNNIYYGSVNFCNKVLTEVGGKGIFINDNFSMEVFLNIFKEKMFNYDSKILTISEVLKLNLEEEQYFMRPDNDNKLFDGEVISKEFLKEKLIKLIDCEQADLNTKILLGKPFGCKKEWRNFVVDGEIVSSTLYREDFNIKKSREDIPEEMLNFVKSVIAIFQPHNVFCIDIVLSGDEYYILEFGSLNSCGFYAADIEKIMLAIVKHFQ
jgi:hypothetical protein